MYIQISFVFIYLLIYLFLYLLIYLFVPVFIYKFNYLLIYSILYSCNYLFINLKREPIITGRQIRCNIAQSVEILKS